MHFRFRYNQTLVLLHTHIRVFAGRSEASLGLCGSLTMRNNEWDELRTVLEAGVGVVGVPASITVEFIPDDLTS